MLFWLLACGVLLFMFTIAQWVKLEEEAVRVVGGRGARMQSIMKQMPFLSLEKVKAICIPGFMQLVIFTIQSQWHHFRAGDLYDFEQERISVSLQGSSTTSCSDVVSITWVRAAKGDKSHQAIDTTPVVIICPGINGHARNLMGMSLYDNLLKRDVRIGVFERRGTVLTLQAPVLHLYGHPSDLHSALARVHERWPDAPIHLIGTSAGNGLIGSYGIMYANQMPCLRSVLMLFGGDDYNCGMLPARSTWQTRLILDTVLLSSCKAALRRHECILCQHHELGFRQAMAAPNLQCFYDYLMQSFSGYADAQEAERKINAFHGGNSALLDVAVPMLIAYTEDDPVSPGGPRAQWIDIFAKCESVALALFPRGSHLPCYDSFRLTRWCDKLVCQWLDAVVK